MLNEGLLTVQIITELIYRSCIIMGKFSSLFLHDEPRPDGTDLVAGMEVMDIKVRGDQLKQLSRS